MDTTKETLLRLKQTIEKNVDHFEVLKQNADDHENRIWYEGLLQGLFEALQDVNVELDKIENDSR